MRQSLFFLLSFGFINFGNFYFPSFNFPTENPSTINTKTSKTTSNSLLKAEAFNVCVNEIYEKINEPNLCKDAFQFAYQGYLTLLNNNQLNNPEVLTVVDFSKSANEKRFFVINLKDTSLMYKNFVAHGRNSGQVYAKDFSNQSESYKSSLGYYLTAETYIGKFGLALRLDGLEKNINDKARERGIVIHGADYVSQEFIRQNGRLGRSLGCPSLPKDGNYNSIIQEIQQGACLFLYYPDKQYFANSSFFQNQNYLANF